MMRCAKFGLLCAILIAAAGCGGSDLLMREALTHLNAYAEMIEKKETPERQAAALARIRSSEEKINKLPPEKKEQLLKQYEQELNRARERIEAALKNQILEGGTPPPNPLDHFLK
jgi:hypothetical protein